MAEHDYVIANQNGANTRSDLNNALAAIVSNNSKASAPTTTYAYMWWADTANDILKQRNGADSAWISILTLSTGAPLADYADNALSGNAIDGGIISNFQSTGIDDRLPTGKVLTLSTTGVDIDGGVTCDTVHIDSSSGTILSAGSGADTTVISNGWTGGYGDWVKIEVPSGDDESGMIQLGSDGKTYFSGGIYLNGDTAAANALDDYEEGTWTITITPSTSGTVTVNSGINTGHYTKVGSLVTVHGQITISAVDAPVGNARINLPFTAGTGTEKSAYSAGAVGTHLVNWASGASLFMRTGTGSAVASLLSYGDGIAWALVTADAFSANDELCFSLSYNV